MLIYLQVLIEINAIFLLAAVIYTIKEKMFSFKNIFSLLTAIYCVPILYTKKLPVINNFYSRKIRISGYCTIPNYLMGIYIASVNGLFYMIFIRNLNSFFLKDTQGSLLTVIIDDFMRYMLLAIMIIIFQFLIHQTLKRIIYIFLIKFYPHKVDAIIRNIGTYNLQDKTRFIFKEKKYVIKKFFTGYRLSNQQVISPEDKNKIIAMDLLVYFCNEHFVIYWFSHEPYTLFSGIIADFILIFYSFNCLKQFKFIQVF